MLRRELFDDAFLPAGSTPQHGHFDGLLRIHLRLGQQARLAERVRSLGEGSQPLEIGDLDDSYVDQIVPSAGDHEPDDIVGELSAVEAAWIYNVVEPLIVEAIRLLDLGTREERALEIQERVQRRAEHRLFAGAVPARYPADRAGPFRL